MPFFKPFPVFLRFFQNFFPAVSSISLVFPSLPFMFSSSLLVFSQFSPIFLHVPVFLTMFLHFPWFFLPFPSVFKGPRENRTPPSPNCLVVHALLKNSNIEILVHLGNLHPPHPLYSLRSRKQLCLASAGFRKIIIEGSLEVKLPTIWTVEKQRWDESEETRSEERSCRCAKR